jgi:hypothetical protein
MHYIIIPTIFRFIWIKKEGVCALFFYPNKPETRLSRVDRVGWADVGARAAVFALRGIDFIVAIDLSDRAFGAFGFAGCALYAVIFRNYVRHGFVPFEIRFGNLIADWM